MPSTKQELHAYIYKDKLNQFRRQFFWCFFCWSLFSIAKPLDEAFLALSRYDYFKAKTQFYKITSKKPNAYADYGLAMIFKRKDNPFHNPDSAGIFIHRCLNTFRHEPLVQTFSNFRIDEQTIQTLLDSVATSQLVRIKSSLSVNDYDLFLQKNYLADRKIIAEAVYKRDELEFNNVMQFNRSDSTILFIDTHPQSSFYSDALLLIDRQEYDEQTIQKTAEAYKGFIKRNPKNIMVPSAYEQLFSIYRRNSDKNGLRSFVYDYPEAAQNKEAWKLLFALSVHSFSDEELIRFLAEYPEFPLKGSILKDLQHSKLNLFPFRYEGLYGFIDSTARIVISPHYDSVSYFSEGLSVVSRNDSVFYINKENENVFESGFEEAFAFKNGLAAVKQNGNCFFINRQGQAISAYCQEINEISDNMYVFKFNEKHGAVDHFGRKVFEARFDKLGDFKNGHAYYQEGNRYGFVSANGKITRLQFDWISDFDANQLAIYKQNNKYGLIHSSGKILLEALYEQVLRAGKAVYILVLGSNYGFYSAQGCFITQLIYEYQKEKPEDYYYKEQMFRLLKNKSQALMDENGFIRINFGLFDEVGFQSNGLYCVKKKNKYGYLDKKLQTAIPLQFELASDFEDSLSIVKTKGTYKLINTMGKELISSTTTIQKISADYFLINKEGIRQLYYRSGKLLAEQVKEIQVIKTGIIIITLNNAEIKLLRDETFVNLKSKM